LRPAPPCWPPVPVEPADPTRAPEIDDPVRVRAEIEAAVRAANRTLAVHQRVGPRAALAATPTSRERTPSSAARPRPLMGGHRRAAAGGARIRACPGGKGRSRRRRARGVAARGAGSAAREWADARRGSAARECRAGVATRRRGSAARVRRGSGDARRGVRAGVATRRRGAARECGRGECGAGVATRARECGAGVATRGAARRGSAARECGAGVADARRGSAAAGVRRGSGDARPHPRQTSPNITLGNAKCLARRDLAADRADRPPVERGTEAAGDHCRTIISCECRQHHPGDVAKSSAGRGDGAPPSKFHSMSPPGDAKRSAGRRARGGAAVAPRRGPSQSAGRPGHRTAVREGGHESGRPVGRRFGRCSRRAGSHQWPTPRASRVPRLRRRSFRSDRGLRSRPLAPRRCAFEIAAGCASGLGAIVAGLRPTESSE